jgi:hypothetical protein
MEEILKFENMDKLYEFLIKDFGFKKIEEKYYPDAFGNFYVTLFSRAFLIRYNNDRLFLTIEIASNSDPDYWLALSFIKDFIYDKENINSGPVLSNTARIHEGNDFLQKDFNRIQELYSDEKYPEMKREITDLLIKQSKRKFS